MDTLDSSTLRLQKIQSMASIASSIAIPVVLAFAGYAVQERLAEDGLRKDYVSVAVGILKDNPKGQDPSLRGWATTVLTLYSPVKFSDEAKKGLETALFAGSTMPELPVQARQLQSAEGCLPSCLQSFTEDSERWAKELSASNASPANAAKALASVLNKASERAREASIEADQARIRGAACEAIYDVLAKGN